MKNGRRGNADLNKTKQTTDRSLLPQFARAMLEPGFYPGRPDVVRFQQTQMSFVFIAGDLVYKVKKPVNLGYLDYTTLEKRRYFCERETSLNRRLCPDTYLDVVPIAQKGQHIALGETGEIIEYAVRMRYLPQDRMLNILLVKDEATPQMVEALAARVSNFHQGAETNAQIGTFGDIAAIRGNTEENFDQTEKSIGRTISSSKFERIKRFAREFLATNESLFKERVTEGRIRDCHGDLHAAHVCFADGICIFDCIEFNDRFRYGDTASEVAFLAMDLDHYGRADLGATFVSSYVNSSRDAQLPRLLPFYKCYRAYVRGKVESFKLEDPYLPEKEKTQARETATGYFDLASFYTRSKPTLFITVGVTGTGKTTFARAISRRLGLAMVSSDVVRKQLAGVPLTEHRFDGFQAGLYAEDFSQRTYDTMLNQARDKLASRCSVVLDATFIRKSDRLKAMELAERASADYFVVEFTATEETIKKRLAERSLSKSVSDGRIEILEPQMQRFETVNEVSERQHVLLDPSTPLSHKIESLLAKLAET